MESLWLSTVGHRQADSLEKDIKTDVLIIGGGLAGLLCAYMLRQSGANCVVAEAKTVCSGITENTTAKITSQHGLIYDKLISRFSKEKAKLYLAANQAALSKYRELCRNMDCDFEEKSAFVYSLDDRGKLEKEIAALDKLGFRVRFTSQIPLPLEIAGAVEFPNQAQFHPLKFTFAISEGIKIYEHTAVRELIDNTAYTDRGKIKAEKVIIATHFPFINKHGMYFLKLYQHRSYVIALENAPQVNGMYVDEAQKGMSFRNYNNLLLVGGGDHRTGKSGGGFRELREFAAANYPEASEKYCWATQDCMSLDGVPYIGRYSPSTENLYVATGFNKWGMTSSMAAAMLLCDMVQGKENPYECLFDPSRSMLHPQLALNALETTVSLLTPTQKRCAHLGCALKWNKAEHSWDCPCHGSRFSQDGRLLDNPATGDLKTRREK